MKPNPPTKSVRVYPEIHRELKIRVASTGENITEFVSAAIKEKLQK